MRPNECAGSNPSGAGRAQILLGCSFVMWVRLMGPPEPPTEFWVKVKVGARGCSSRLLVGRGLNWTSSDAL